MSALYSKAFDHLPTEQDEDCSYTDPEHIPTWHKRRTSGGVRRKLGQSHLNPSNSIYDEMGQENSAVYMEFEQDSSHSSHSNFNPHARFKEDVLDNPLAPQKPGFIPLRSGVDMIDGAGLVGRGPSADESSVYSYAADPDAEVQRRQPKTQRSVSLDEEYSVPPDTVPLPKGPMVGSQDYQEPYHSKGLVREPVPEPGSIYLLARDVPPKQSDGAIDPCNRLNDLSNDFRGVRLNSQDSQEKNSYDHLWSSKATPGTGSVQTAQATNSRAPKTNKKAPSDFISTRLAQMEQANNNNPPGSYEEPWDSEEGRKKFESVIKKAEKTHERRVSNTNDSSTTPNIQKTNTNATNPTPAVSQASNGNIYGLAWSSPMQKPDPAPSLSASNASRNPTTQQQRKPPAEAGAANYEDAWDLPEKQRELEEKLLKAGLPKKSPIQTKPDPLQREATVLQRDDIHEDISMFRKKPSLTIANQAPVMPVSPMRRSHPLENTSRANSCRSLAALAEKIDRDLPLEEQNFYHGTLKRTDAERMLTVFKEGSYLIRRSEANKNDFSLTLKGHGNLPIHMKITSRPDGTYVLGENSPPFNTIPMMVDYYTSHQLPVQNAERICLLYPIPS